MTGVLVPIEAQAAQRIVARAEARRRALEWAQAMADAGWPEDDSDLA